MKPASRVYKTQLNTWVPTTTRDKIDAYLEYMARPPDRRTKESEENNWPTSIVDLVNEALTDFLALHQLEEPKGPVKRKEPRT